MSELMRRFTAVGQASRLSQPSEDERLGGFGEARQDACPTNWARRVFSLLKSRFLLGSILAFTLNSAALEPCRIEVIERGSGWPVPLVELRTTHSQRFVSDNNGLIACDSPELMNREVWFDVIGHGYEVKKDGFGMRGVRLTPQPGKTLKVEVDRKNIAKRLGRITGAGIFAESQKLGIDLDWKESGVFGCDSVQNAVYDNKMFWAWGDTTLPNYPLGIFDSSSATTAIQPLKSFQPPVKLTFDYFRDANGRPRGVAKMPGSGPTWLYGYATLRDNSGRGHLVATYSKIRNHLEVYETGLCAWNDEKAAFDRVRVVWEKSSGKPKPLVPDGHPSFWKDAQGKEWLLLGNPFPMFRCPATFEAWQDSSQWEALKPQRSVESSIDGKTVRPHTGHIMWSDFRKRWITVFMEAGGKPSGLGELWYAEAELPLGPWGKAVKVVTHENYTFYNPRLHPEFTPANSPTILFEATFTAEFADRPQVSPRNNYNQVLYRLDLDDSALKAAQ